APLRKDTATPDMFGEKKEPAKGPDIPSKEAALKIYNKLTDIKREKPLTQSQSTMLEAAERKLGQQFLPEAKPSLMNAYQKLKSETGLSAVNIGKLRASLGLSKDEMSYLLLDQARKGNADLHPTTLAEGHGMETMPIPGREEPAVNVTLRPDKTDAPKASLPPMTKLDKQNAFGEKSVTSQQDLLGEKKPGQQS